MNKGESEFFKVKGTAYSVEVYNEVEDGVSKYGYKVLWASVPFRSSSANFNSVQCALVGAEKAIQHFHGVS